MPKASTKADRAERISERQRYETLKAKLWLDRASFEAHWRELADNLDPVRPQFMVTDRNRGDRRTKGIYDNTATYALQILSSGLHSGLTSPARPWFSLSVPDASLAKFPPVRQWCHDVTTRMHSVFQLSNLYNALPLVYRYMGGFGTAAVGILDDPGGPGRSGDLFRAYTYPLGSYAMAMDARGLVTTFARKFVMTVSQLVEMFGGVNGQPLEFGESPDWSRFSRQVKDQWNRGNYEETVTVVWIVQPNRQREDKRFSASFPWLSCHFEDSSNSDVLLRESGFHEFPILAPRWFASPEDVYGTDCPGITALGDIKQLQTMTRREGQAIEKMVNPPLVGPPELKSQKVSLLPSDMTYLQETGKPLLRPLHEVKPDLSHFMLAKQDVRGRIFQAFYVDLFLMISQGSEGAQPVTAREIQERHEEKLVALGPVLESTIDELLDPLIDRVFGMMDRAGLVPPPPQELEGVELRVEYVSILAQAMKMQQLGLLDRFIQTSAVVGQAYPEAALVANPRRILRDYADGLGLAPELTRTDDEIDAILASQQRAAQAQAQADQVAKVAGAAKALGSTPMQGDTALNRLVEGLSG